MDPRYLKLSLLHTVWESNLTTTSSSCLTSLNLHSKYRCLKFGISSRVTKKAVNIFEQEVTGSSLGNSLRQKCTGVISLIFDKAALEPTFCPMYAQLCSYLNEKLTPFPSTDEPGGEEITFEHVLLNNCDEAYEGAEFSEQSK
ncbi:hypothetical protein FXO38_06916 [Capsicum annuum]|nr:hypothetical protein FXO37_17864 [Capsicum annuum]KAF3670786.1 hypothetical protein FXO38_06916 [Capsicum annuum]